MPDIYAHSLSGRPLSEWEPLPVHAQAVAAHASANAEPFGCAVLAAALGLLHDIGKCSPDFQQYILAGDAQAHGPDHSTAGAVEALKAFRGPFGRIVAFIIAGHHAGLADGVDLEPRLKKTLPPYDGWQTQTGPLPDLAALRPTTAVKPSLHRGFGVAFLIRMLFSCLVDADFIETERFSAKGEGRAVEREGFSTLPILRDRLSAFMQRKRAASTGPLADLRAKVLDHAIGKAELPPGLFTLTVPTGGGKTLTSLSFALEHAVRHGLRRVVYVIPFTSIIEQTAGVFREALGEAPGRPNHDDILEHHATFDWEAADRRAGDAQGEDGRGSDPLDRLRRAAENWAAPIVVTTAVQFFESLYANRTSRCRKLHNLAKSVIVLDEAQTLPLNLLKPCTAALDELQRNYGASIVLCTATQPALRKQDGFDAKDDFRSALDICDKRELAPDPKGLYTALKRVAVERLDAVTDEAIAARFAEQPQTLCIVNTRAHAQALFARIRDLPGAVHLSTLMCPAHRRIVLAEARRRLKDGQPVRIVSTSLIEAGVDIDFPEVWRAAAGLDSIIQAAGRANREGRLPGLGRVVVFEPAEGKPPPDLDQAWQAGRSVLRRFNDPLGLDAVQAYFRELYWTKGPEALDAARLDGERYPILQRIAERAPQNGERDPALAFPFASIAKAFRVIEEVMEPVIVPWSAGPEDREAETILARVAAMDKPLGPDLRKLQQYVVSIPRRQRSEWLALGALRPVHRALGDALLRFWGLEHYDSSTGVKLGAPLERSAESNLF